VGRHDGCENIVLNVRELAQCSKLLSPEDLEVVVGKSTRFPAHIQHTLAMTVAGVVQLRDTSYLVRWSH
jgi:hypothetical protein